jgi:hypothetical protein
VKAHLRAASPRVPIRTAAAASQRDWSRSDAPPRRRAAIAARPPRHRVVRGQRRAELLLLYKITAHLAGAGPGRRAGRRLGPVKVGGLPGDRERIESCPNAPGPVISSGVRALASNSSISLSGRSGESRSEATTAVVSSGWCSDPAWSPFRAGPPLDSDHAYTENRTDPALGYSSLMSGHDQHRSILCGRAPTAPALTIWPSTLLTR